MNFFDAFEAALNALTMVEHKRQSEKRAFHASVRKAFRKKSQLRLSYLILFETVKRLNTIDAVLERVYSGWKRNEIPHGIRSFLRIFVYWTKFRENPTGIEGIVRQARRYLGEKTLERFEAGLGEILELDLESFRENFAEDQRLALELFHPEWLIKYCVRLFGRDFTVKLLAANMKQLPVYIRVNALLGDEETTLHTLKGEGVACERVEDLDYVYRVRHTKEPLLGLRSYQRGLFQIQDKASCFAVVAARPRPGEEILDVCAAPGGKTSFLAHLMNNEGRVFSTDYSHDRIEVWQRQIERMHVRNAEPVICDCRLSIPLRKRFDLILVDPPCSGTGVLMKMPSMKWRLTPRSFDTFRNRQLGILNNCAPLLKGGGRIFYSTCSISVEENERVVEDFLVANPDFEVREVTPRIGLPGLLGYSECQRLYPHLHDCNGFFVARLERV